jgi:hypothetical protein
LDANARGEARVDRGNVSIVNASFVLRQSLLFAVVLADELFVLLSIKFKDAMSELYLLTLQDVLQTALFAVPLGWGITFRVFFAS